MAARDVGGAFEKLAAGHPQHEFLAQPLIESVITEGEWSFIFIGGECAHALLKKPAPGDSRAHGIYGGTVELAEPRRDGLRDAEAMVKRLPFDLLMKLELIEPMLCFTLAPEGVGKLVDATIARIVAPR